MHRYSDEGGAGGDYWVVIWSIGLLVYWSIGLLGVSGSGDITKITCLQHRTWIKNYAGDFARLAEEIGDLRYDSLAELSLHLPNYQQTN